MHREKSSRTFFPKIGRGERPKTAGSKSHRTVEPTQTGDIVASQNGPVKLRKEHELPAGVERVAFASLQGPSFRWSTKNQTKLNSVQPTRNNQQYESRQQHRLSKSSRAPVSNRAPPPKAVPSIRQSQGSSSLRANTPRQSHPSPAQQPSARTPRGMIRFSVDSG